MSAPLISVIIPFYNSSRFLPQALESIAAQEIAPLEIIIVDDGSSEAEAVIAKSAGHYIRQENKGPAAARNTGLKAAKGEFIAFLDADDMWSADKLTNQLQVLEENPSVDVVTGRIKYMWEDGVTDKPMEMQEDNTLFHVHLGALLARRSVFERVGGFNEALRFSEDHDWWLRVREAGLSISILDEIMLHYRRHAGNMTRGQNFKDFGLLGVLKNSLSRRRAVGQAGDLPSFFSHKKAGQGG